MNGGVVRIKIRRLALEIGAGRFVESLRRDGACIALRAECRDHGIAGDVRNVAVGAAPAAGGRELHVENVVAGEFGMHAVPSRPAGNDVKVAAHIESPTAQHCIDGQEHHDAERKRAQHLHHASVTRLARRRHSWRERRRVHTMLHNGSLAAVSVPQAAQNKAFARALARLK